MFDQMRKNIRKQMAKIKKKEEGLMIERRLGMQDDLEQKMFEISTKFIVTFCAILRYSWI